MSTVSHGGPWCSVSCRVQSAVRRVDVRGLRESTNLSEQSIGQGCCACWGRIGFNDQSGADSVLAPHVEFRSQRPALMYEFEAATRGLLWL